MWNKPTEKRLAKIPKLYATENIRAKDKKIYLHFFIGGSDWYIAEYDGDDTFFGFCILNGDTSCAEWGYVSFKELQSLRMGFVEVDCEKASYWKTKKASEISRIANFV